MQKELIFIGLGKMGSAMSERLVRKGYIVHGFDDNSDIQKNVESGGVVRHETLEKTIEANTTATKTIWIMVPSRFVDDVISALLPLLTQGDTIIDGGNSFFKDSIRRYEELKTKEINFIDCGTSGGVEGALHGASLMVGGEAKIVEEHRELFTDLAVADGFAHVGNPGAGHFTKMVHNGIEYGMMGAIAEGIAVLHGHKDSLDIDIKEVLKPYQHGSIIESKLLSWLGEAVHEEGYLDAIAGEVPHGETEIEMEYLIKNERVKMLETAVQQRKDTRTEPSFIGTLISAMRNKFGGHATLKNKSDV